MESINPVGRPSRMIPSVALLRCNFNCISGMREAQLAKHNPAKKKKLLTAILKNLLCENAIVVSVDKEMNCFLLAHSTLQVSFLNDMYMMSSMTRTDKSQGDRITRFIAGRTGRHQLIICKGSKQRFS